MIDASPVASAPVTGLRSLLEAGLQEIGLTLDPNRVDTLLAFGDLLLRWNRTYNLTAIRSARDVITHHLLDCLAIVPILRQQCGGLATRRILDVGSGAGLPGLAIAISDPDAHVVCVDRVGKKAAFMTQAIATLRLHNAEAVHGRVESLPPQGFDVIVSRAFASLVDFVQSTERLLDPGGSWIAMKGKVPDAEIEAVSASLAVRAAPVRVPDLDAARCVVRMTRRDISGEHALSADRRHGGPPS